METEAKLQEIKNLMRSHTDRDDERRIIAILAEATAEELAYLLANLDLHALIHDVDDRVVGPNNRTRLLHLLTVQRIDEIPISVRAMLILALQRGRTGSVAEESLARIFLATRGSALTQLKNVLDATGTYRDLHQLLYHDIDDAALRNKILQHISTERHPCGEVKILSDIDDTFYANWKDKRYPEKTVYPGVRQFYAELDRGGGKEAGRKGDLTFVTARPGDRAGLVQQATLSSLRERGLMQATVLAGSFTRLIGNRSIAKKKLENFVQYQALYPEYGFVFVGDSGQGDILFAQQMIEQTPDAVKGVFIHDVIATPEDRRQQLRAAQVHLFDTYVGAAVFALKLKLIGPSGAVAVARSALDELAGIGFHSEQQQTARRQDLIRDMFSLRDLLPDELKESV